MKTRAGSGSTATALRRTALLALAALAAGAAPSGAAGVSSPAGVQLSNERTISYWANALERMTVRTAPRPSARSVARLRLETEDGLPEVYLALRSAVDGSGRTWFQVRVPMRPNGTTGWVRAEALGPLHVVRTRLVVDRSRLRATLFRSGRAVWSAPVAIGLPQSPTPAGRFYVRERLRSLNPFYGPLAFGTSAYSSLSDWPGGGVVGIHGTNQPELIPGRRSHGCVRLRNADVLRLDRLMPLGTPVLIR